MTVDFNSAGIAALEAQVLNVRWIVFLDIASLPLRVTNADRPLQFDVLMADPLLAGFTYGKIDNVLDVSEVFHQPGGGGGMTFILSGLPSIDTAELNAIGDKSRWQGRTAAVWAAVLDPVTHAVISVKRIHSGPMGVPKLGFDGTSQTIVLDIESEAAIFAEAGNSSYLDQARIDPTDQIAGSILSAASGLSRSRGIGGTDDFGFSETEFGRFDQRFNP